MNRQDKSGRVFGQTQVQELYDKVQQAGIAVSLVKQDDGRTFKTPEARPQLAMEAVAVFDRYLRVNH